MDIETNYGTIRIDNPGHYEGDVYMDCDCDLEEMPENLRSHIDEIIRTNKQRAFEEKKEKLRERGYHTLAELEKEQILEIEKPYIGIHLDLNNNKMESDLHINAYDISRECKGIEFNYEEAIVIDPRVIMELVITTVLASIKASATGQAADSSKE